MAAKANLIVDQGTDFIETITLTDAAGNIVDLTDYTGAGQARRHHGSANAVPFAVTMGGNTGVVTIELTDTQTNSMKAGKYVYDVEVTAGGTEVSRILEGILTITPSATK